MTAQQKKLLAPLVDELGDMTEELLAAALVVKRADTIKKAIRAAVCDVEPHEPATVEGKTYAVDLTAQQERQVIKSKARLKTALGDRKFIQFAIFAFNALKDALSPADFQRLIEKQRIGPRTLTVRPLGK